MVIIVMASMLEIIGELHINIQSMHDINQGNPEIVVVVVDLFAIWFYNLNMQYFAGLSQNLDVNVNGY